MKSIKGFGFFLYVNLEEDKGYLGVGWIKEL